MKQTVIILAAMFLLSFTAGEKTVDLKFTKQNYDAIQANLGYAFRVLDSVKIVLHYSSVQNKELEASMTQAQSGLAGVSNFIAQIDTSFKK